MSLSESYPDRFSTPFRQTPETHQAYAAVCSSTNDIIDIWRQCLKEPLGPGNQVELLRVSGEYSAHYLAFSKYAYQESKAAVFNSPLPSPYDWAPRFMDYIQDLTEMRTISINQIFHPTARFWHRWTGSRQALLTNPYIKYSLENTYSRWDRHFRECAQAMDQIYPDQTDEEVAATEATARILQEQLGGEYALLEEANKRLFNSLSV